jgi:hypothetical protein
MGRLFQSEQRAICSPESDYNLDAANPAIYSASEGICGRADSAVAATTSVLVNATVIQLQ